MGPIRFQNFVTKPLKEGLPLRYYPFAHPESTRTFEYFSNDPKYNDIVFSMSTEPQYSGSTAKKFVKLAEDNKILLQPLSSEAYASIVDEIVTNVKSMCDEDLFAILYHLRHFPVIKWKEPVFMKVWKSIDDECVNRWSKWSLNKLFQIDDLFVSLGLGGKCSFHWALVKRLLRKSDYLDYESYIKFMFTLCEIESIASTVNLYCLEHNLLRHLEAITAPDLAIVCAGLANLTRPIHDRSALKKILRKVIDGLDSLDATSISKIAKCLQYSSHYEIENDLNELFDALIPHLDRFYLHPCSLILYVSLRAKIRNEKLVDAVIKKTEKLIDEGVKVSLKDLERIAEVAATFNMDFTSLGKKIIAMLESPDPSTLNQMKTYAKSLANTLYFLNVAEMYSEKLTNHFLSPEFLRSTYGKRLVILCKPLIVSRSIA